MRIRKNNPVSPLIYAMSTLKPGIVVQPMCQLNQSPWDVMSFSPPPPPPPSQVNCTAASVSLNGAVPAPSLSGPSDTMQEMEVDTPPQQPPPAAAAAAKCCKTDGKSWQCRREAAKGHSLCDHHLTLVKSYSSNSSHHPVKKGDGLPPRRPRPKKAAANPDEFYYYSGFGPRWGRKRGESSRSNNNNSGDEYDQIRKMEIRINQIDGEEDSDNVEYEDDDDEDEDKNGGEVGRKRVRKRIKARSLKSLM